MVDLLKALIMPSNFAVLCILTGLGLLFFYNLRKIAVILLATAGAIIIIFSTGTVAALLLSPLEYEFPYLKNPEDHPEVTKIVVLTHYGVDDPLMPLSSRFSSSSAFRLLEANHLYLECGKCDIIVTGNADGARIMKQQLLSMAVPENRILEDGEAPHTYDSARNLKSHIADEPFYLVTSAGHLPRAMRVFRKEGMHPIPAPTDFQLPRNAWNAAMHPSPQHLYWSDLAVAEYAGMVWYKLRGRI